MVVRFVRIVPKVVMQNGGDLSDAILHIKPNLCHYTYLLVWKWCNFCLQQSSRCGAVQFVLALWQVLPDDQEVPRPPATLHAVHRIHMSVIGPVKKSTAPACKRWTNTVTSGYWMFSQTRNGVCWRIEAASCCHPSQGLKWMNGMLTGGRSWLT